jgi:hypothetical protein
MKKLLQILVCLVVVAIGAVFGDDILEDSQLNT